MTWCRYYVDGSWRQPREDGTVEWFVPSDFHQSWSDVGMKVGDWHHFTLEQFVEQILGRDLSWAERQSIARVEREENQGYARVTSIAPSRLELIREFEEFEEPPHDFPEPLMEHVNCRCSVADAQSWDDPDSNPLDDVPLPPPVSLPNGQDIDTASDEWLEEMADDVQRKTGNRPTHLVGSDGRSRAIPDPRNYGGHCSCSPQGEPHSPDCKGWFPGQPFYAPGRGAKTNRDQLAFVPEESLGVRPSLKEHAEKVEPGPYSQPREPCGSCWAYRTQGLGRECGRCPPG